jgi:hypothetical protein
MEAKLSGFMGKAVAAALSSSSSGTGSHAPAGAVPAKSGGSTVERLVSKAVDHAMEAAKKNPELIKKVGGAR